MQDKERFMSVNDANGSQLLIGSEGGSLPPLMTKDGKIVGRRTLDGRVKALPPTCHPLEPSQTWTAAETAPVVVDNDGYVLSYTEDDGIIVNLCPSG